VGSGFRDEELTCGNAQPDHHIEFLQSLSGHGFRAEEVERTKCSGVSIDEVLPGTGYAIGTGLNALFLQDIAYSLAADLFDAKLSKLAQNPCIPEQSRLRNRNHQVADLLRLPSSTADRWFRLPSAPRPAAFQIETWMPVAEPFGFQQCSTLCQSYWHFECFRCVFVLAEFF